TPDIQIPGLSDSRRLQSFVKYDQLLAFTAPADRDFRVLILRTSWNRVIATGDRRLSGAIKVGKPDLRQTLHPVDQRWRRQSLSAPEQPLQRRKIVESNGVELGHVPESGRDRKPLGQF